jgi:uncharacterized protein
MSIPRWLLALPLTLAATIGTVSGSSVRDQAGMFSADAVKQAEAELNQVERTHRIATVIETVGSLQGQDIADVSLDRAERSGIHGIYILIARDEHKLYSRVSGQYRRAINAGRQAQIREAIEAGFKKRDFDGGLLQGVKAIRTVVDDAVSKDGRLPAGAPPGGRGRALPMPRGHQGGFGLGTLLGIGLVIVAVLIGIRLLGALFGGGARGYGAPGGMRRPGFGPGYGAPGGGGFMSSLFGGIGGALAGNWLYDQFSGRHHGGYSDSSAYGGTPTVGPDPDDWSSGGGGAWGGGDAGGGGDWGGGGGDWGGGDGGGGDW